MYLNQIMIIGNVTRDPETKETQTGKKRTTFGVAVNSGKDQVDFFDVVQFDKPWPDDMVKKGSPVLVQGAMCSHRADDGRVYWALVATKLLALTTKKANGVKK
ncbi:MAG TPA: hypothetical protein DD811_01760 [Syntrophomonas sp.]|jgi:single-stranded DNA-binding protein|nr:hypothetical protein [Syntrophomonas sp.]